MSKMRIYVRDATAYTVMLMVCWPVPYVKQREHALGGDHITIPDELEKNGQPQNEKNEI